MLKLAAQIRASRSVNQLQAFVQAAVASAGGLERLLKDWHSVLQAMLSSRRATPRLVAFYEATFRMAAMIDQSRQPTAPDKSDQYLLSRIREVCMTALKEDPDLVLNAAALAGWDVVPRQQMVP